MASLARRPLHAVAGLLGMALVAACGGGSTSQAPKGQAYDQNATLRVAMAAPPTNLDPALQSVADVMYTSLLYDSLTQLSPDGNKVLPMLATSWNVTDGGKAMVFKLRTDVTFHDGTAFNATAVKANLDRSKTVPGSTVAAALEAISSVDAVDAATVKLNLVPGRGASLPATLATNAGEMLSPKAISAGQNFKVEVGSAGSGPYTLTQYQAGTGATYTRSAKYWDPAYNDRVKTLVITPTSVQASMNGVRAGQYDVGQVPSGPFTAQALDLAKQGAFEASSYTIRGFHIIELNSSKAPLDNLAVRQAIQYGIDRDAIAKDLFKGACVSSYQPFLKGSSAYNTALDTKYQYDAAKATQLLTQSGVKNPQLKIEASPAQQDDAIAVQSQLQKIGFQVQFTPVTQAVVFPNFAAGQSMATIVGIVPGADPGLYVSQYVVGGQNFSRGGDPTQVAKVKALATQADDPSLSDQKRGQVFQQIQQIVTDQVWMVQICNGVQLWLHSPKVANVDATWQGATGALPYFGNLKMKVA